MTQLSIPDSVTYIGLCAIEYCNSLESLTIPGSVKTLGVNAVSHCEALKSVTIQEGVTYIDQWNFSGCNNLTDVKLPNTLEIIDAVTFQWCDSLKSIKIPDSVTSIGSSAFMGDNNLSTIIVPTCNTYAYKWALEKKYAVTVEKHQNVVADQYVAPTDTEPGLTEGAHCTVCGETIKAQEVIPGTSAEGKIKGFVTRCYQIILGRLPDPEGMNTWYNELNSGRKAASEIIDSFVKSVEFQNRKLNRDAVVEVLYKAMLGRGSDPMGKADWVSKLNEGQPVAVVINGFCGSAEFKNICDSYGIRTGSVDNVDDIIWEDRIKGYVTRCYQIILGREPDMGGMNTWVEELSSGRKGAAEIINQFVKSQEFKNKNYSNADAVEILYKAMLGRGSDPTGRASWVSRLDAGEPLAAVINGFSGSDEFGYICDTYGIWPGSVGNF